MTGSVRYYDKSQEIYPGNTGTKSFALFQEFYKKKYDKAIPHKEPPYCNLSFKKYRQNVKIVTLLGIFEIIKNKI